MSIDLLIAIAVFCLVTVGTPGPNNLMLMASGANFGLRRSLPHMLGIILGFPAMVFLVGVGVMRVFDAWPASYTVLQGLSIAYLLYLAWKIAHAAAPGQGQAGGSPLSFAQSAAFQWVNPKAWSMALSAITLYAGNRDFQAVLAISLIYVLMAVPSTTGWTILGQQMRRFLTNPRRLRVFNLTMAGLLVASLAMALWPQS